MKMATTIELEPGSHREQALRDAPDTFMRHLAFPDIRWGAVFAGVVVGVSVQLVLTLLGIASGFSAIDVSSGEGVGNGPLLWAGFSMLVAAFIGGYVAARMSGLKRKVDGMLHGAVSWAVTTLLFVTLTTSASGALLSGVFSNIGPMARTATADMQDSGMSAMLTGQLGINVDPATLQTLQQHIRAGRRNEAIQLITSMGINQSRAAGIVDQALILSGSPQQASAEGRATADRAINAASTVAWTAFFAVALSLALGVGGGVLGAMGAQRKTWTGSSPMKKSVTTGRPT